jgi:hypothetical protein
VTAACLVGRASLWLRYTSANAFYSLLGEFILPCGCGRHGAAWKVKGMWLLVDLHSLVVPCVEERHNTDLGLQDHSFKMAG